MELQSARVRIAACVEAGNLSEEVLACLRHNDTFLPAEGLLFDYKRDVPQSRIDYLKTLRHIAAFHNTYGGYLIFGAEEASKDEPVVANQSSLPFIDSKRLRDLIREYLSAVIEVQTTTFKIHTGDGEFELALLHIPKRTSRDPVLFHKVGFDDKNNKIFDLEQAYLRDGDNSVPATKAAHWQTLFGERKNPYSSKELFEISLPLENNLPDRSFIYQSFVGREDTLEKLWGWLKDDFSCVRVLAGEGGLGKTSIAYEFSEEVCKVKPCGLETVIWLTAKTHQFRGIDDQYDLVPITHYSSSTELFHQALMHLGMLEEEVSGISDSQIPKLFHQTAKQIRSLIVIDDLDSLPIDEQKRAVEVCQQMSGTGSRFLFTTRKNATASAASAIQLEGFVFSDFQEFVNGWTTRLQISACTEAQLRSVYATTNGSPLYTESFLRLLRVGMDFKKALSSWSGKLGVDVRKAALEREVMQLTQQARKLIVAAAVYGVASYDELKDATDYSDQTLQDGLNELQSLFLISLPEIAEQPRFRIAQTTRELVFSLGSTLLSEYEAFAANIKSERYTPSKKELRSDIPGVGAAINLAMAQLRQGKVNEALITIDSMGRDLPQDNADLIYMRARLLVQLKPRKNADVSATFSRAYDKGQRKLEFFNRWFAFECECGNYEKAIDISSKAILVQPNRPGDWLQKRGGARIQSANSKGNSGDRVHAIKQLDQAIVDVGEAKKYRSAEVDDVVFAAMIAAIHDARWNFASRGASTVTDWVDMLDTQLAAVARGDVRVEIYERAVASLHQMITLSTRQPDGATSKQRALFSVQAKRVSTSLYNARNMKRDPRLADARRMLEEIQRNMVEE